LSKSLLGSGVVALFVQQANNGFSSRGVAGEVAC
jgi:hypothetical protein